MCQQIPDKIRAGAVVAGHLGVRSMAPT